MPWSQLTLYSIIGALPTTFSAVQVIVITVALVMAAFLSDLEKVETVHRVVVGRDLIVGS